MPYRFQPRYRFLGYRGEGGGVIGAAEELGPEDGVWPREFQSPRWYTRAGSVGRWDSEPWEDPLHPSAEFRRGDFFELKNLRTGDLEPPGAEVLAGLIKVYQYWIALSDCDGFRVDTVKHVSWEASRNFCGAIHEYAQSIGKENFLLLGEVTGGADMARNYLEIFGRNLDAVLDIGAPAAALRGFTKGLRHPQDFFRKFGGHDALGTHREVGKYHVSVLDDHDMVGQKKARYAAGNTTEWRHEQVAHAAGVQLTTLGIPCLYYGTEQALDGTVDRHDARIEPPDGHGEIPFADRYVREAMFGATFGAFRTSGCHFFDPGHPTYQRIAAIARVRNGADAVGRCLRRGRQYLRPTSFLGRPFGIWGPGELVAWSRIFVGSEVLMVFNSHGAQARGAMVTVDAALHAAGEPMRYLYRGDWSAAQLADLPDDQTVPVDKGPDGRLVVHIHLPPSGFAILASGQGMQSVAVR